MNYSSAQKQNPMVALLEASRHPVPDMLNETVSQFIQDRFNKNALSGIRTAAELFSGKLYDNVKNSVNNIINNIKNDEPYYDALGDNRTPASTLSSLVSQLDGHDREAFIRQMMDQSYPLDTLSKVVQEVPEVGSDKLIEKLMKAVSNAEKGEEKDKLIDMAINSAKDDAGKRAIEEMIIQTSNQALKLKASDALGDISPSEFKKIEQDILTKNDVTSSASMVAYFSADNIDIEKHLDQVLKSNDRDAISLVLRSDGIEDKISKDQIKELESKIGDKIDKITYEHASINADIASKIDAIQPKEPDEPVNRYENDSPSLG